MLSFARDETEAFKQRPLCRLVPDTLHESKPEQFESVDRQKSIYDMESEFRCRITAGSRNPRTKDIKQNVESELRFRITGASRNPRTKGVKLIVESEFRLKITAASRNSENKRCLNLEGI